MDGCVRHLTHFHSRGGYGSLVLCDLALKLTDFVVFRVRLCDGFLALEGLALKFPDFLHLVFVLRAKSLLLTEEAATFFIKFAHLVSESIYLILEEEIVGRNVLVLLLEKLVSLRRASIFSLSVALRARSVMPSARSYRHDIPEALQKRCHYV